jgi:hypothetical protein
LKKAGRAQHSAGMPGLILCKCPQQTYHSFFKKLIFLPIIRIHINQTIISALSCPLDSLPVSRQSEKCVYTVDLLIIIDGYSTVEVAKMIDGGALVL